MGKGFSAVKTLEGLLTRVDSPVDNQVAALLETFAAFGTLVYSTFSVRQFL